MEFVKVQKGFRFFWLKLEKNFFGDAKIKKLRKLPGGDTLALIYLELMLLSIETNGVLIYEGLEDSFEAELSLKIEEDENSILIVINFLRQYGLLTEIESEDALFLTQNNWSIGSETDSARRKRQAKNADLGKFPENFPLFPERSKEKEKDQKKKKKELDIELEIELEKELDTTATAHAHEKDNVDNSLKYRTITCGEGASKGGAYLFISDAQLIHLHSKYDENTLGYYLNKMNELSIAGYKHGCSDYEYIIKLIEEDRQVKK